MLGCIQVIVAEDVQTILTNSPWNRYDAEVELVSRIYSLMTYFF